MKQSKTFDQVEREMRPGGISGEGFLGQDRRKLIDILVADEAEVKRLGLSHERIADRMTELSLAGARGLGEPIDVDDNLRVRVDSVRGKLPCPFHGGIYAKNNTTVLNRRLNRELTYTDLNVHMIREHGFYEGRGSLFRQNPADLVEILEIREEGPSQPGS